MLDTLSQWVTETPPIEQPQRFGNKAFRTWFDKLKEVSHVIYRPNNFPVFISKFFFKILLFISYIFQNAEQLLKECLDEKFHRAIPEVQVYLVESMGNSTRIDYGTGNYSH